MSHISLMSSITIRQLRQSWPQVERRLAAEHTLVITRDARPVAQLSLLKPSGKAARSRFSAALHAQWMKAAWRGRPAHTDSGRALAHDRAE